MNKNIRKIERKIYMKKIYKNENNKGITLIELVITIVVIILLIYVAVVTFVWKYGFITETVRIDNEYKDYVIIDRLRMGVTSSYDQNGELDLETLKGSINKYIPNAIIDGEEFPITITANKQIYVIDENGNIEEQ